MFAGLLESLHYKAFLMKVNFLQAIPTVANLMGTNPFEANIMHKLHHIEGLKQDQPDGWFKRGATIKNAGMASD